MESKGPSRRWNFAPWNKGQCLHGALFNAVSGCCKCFQQCQTALVAGAESTPPVALKMSSREGLGAMLHGAELHRVDWPYVENSLMTVMFLYMTAVLKAGPSAITSHLYRPLLTSFTSSSTTDRSVEASSCILKKNSYVSPNNTQEMTF